MAAARSRLNVNVNWNAGCNRYISLASHIDNPTAKQLKRTSFSSFLIHSTRPTIPQTCSALLVSQRYVSLGMKAGNPEGYQRLCAAKICASRRCCGTLSELIALLILS